MSIFKRGHTYWFHFFFNGEHVQRSTKQGNARVARDIEAAYRTKLAKGEVGIVDKKPAIKLKDFAGRFRESVKVRCTEKPLTIKFYNSKLNRLLEFRPLAAARLDRIDEAMVEAYVQVRRTPRPAAKAGDPPKVISPASVNRELATLRRLLGLAYEWHLIDRIPVIKKLPGERSREFVINRKQESEYFMIAPQPLRDAALLMLESGMRVGEVVALAKHDVHLDPTNGARLGTYVSGTGSRTTLGGSSVLPRVSDQCFRSDWPATIRLGFFLSPAIIRSLPRRSIISIARSERSFPCQKTSCYIRSVIRC